MKNIIVIDFDKTLLPYDSLRFFVFKLLKNGDLKTLVNSILRKFNLISRIKYSMFLYNRIYHMDWQRDIVRLINDIDKTILDKINANSNDNSVVILLSASPDYYIKTIAQHFNIIGIGSHYLKEEFQYLYAENKKYFIQNNYPKNDYEYKYSISDSKSDLPLLQLFQNYDLIHQ